MFRKIRGFPGGAVVKNLSAHAEYRRLRFNLWVEKIPCSRKWQPTPVFLLGKFHGRKSATVRGVTKSSPAEHTGSAQFRTIRVNDTGI